MTIRPFDPVSDTPRVLALWQECLGGTYPVSERVFLERTAGNRSFERGDGVIAESADGIEGFALMEIPRTARDSRSTAFLSAIAVKPGSRRRGLATSLLSRLLDRARECGCTRVAAGQGPGRFWTGVPEDLPECRALLEKHGFGVASRVWDLYIPLGSYESGIRYRDRLTAEGCRVVSCDAALFPRLLEFELREFPGWVAAIVRMADSGDLPNVLAVLRGEDVVGTIQTYTPKSRWRSQNLVWEREFGPGLGGYGAVGIAKALRGRGLGAAMCEEAALHVERAGATGCFIDWTGLVDFYRKVGAEPWRGFDMMSRDL